MITLPAWKPAFTASSEPGGEQGRGALLGNAGNDAGDGAGNLLVHGIPHIAQVSSLKTLKLSDDELVAVQLDSALDGARDSVGGAHR